MDEKLIREIEALKVGPDEVLILRVPEKGWSDEIDSAKSLLDTLRHAGLQDRSMVIVADDVEFSVVKK